MQNKKHKVKYIQLAYWHSLPILFYKTPVMFIKDASSINRGPLKIQ